jgi:hypothetical protein
MGALAVDVAYTNQPGRPSPASPSPGGYSGDCRIELRQALSEFDQTSSRSCRTGVGCSSTKTTALM